MNDREMPRCYERENYQTFTGEREHNHCGHYVTARGKDYCKLRGNMRNVGYAGHCANTRRMTEVKWDD